MKLSPGLWIILLLPLLGSAQKFTLSGMVKNAEQEPIPFANVMLIQVRDTSQIRGVSSNENGFFEIEEIPSGVYYLQARYFGYESYLIAIEIQKNLNMGSIVLEPDGQLLDEIVLYANTPKVVREGDRIVFQVENSIISQGTTWDILRNAPGVIMVQDNLEIRGQKATVYLNDRKIQLTQQEIQDLLQGMSGEIVSSVEVIPNPPASFEAGDGPVLNIRTNSSVSLGYKGSVFGRVTQAIYPKYAIGTSQYYKNEKVSLFANYTFNWNKKNRKTDAYVNFIENQSTVAHWETDQETLKRGANHLVNLMSEFKISEKELLSLTSNLSISPNQESTTRLETEMRNGANNLDSTLLTQSTTLEEPVNISADLNYTRNLKKEGGRLQGNLHYTLYNQDIRQIGATDYFDPAENFIRNFNFVTLADQQIHIATGQVDLIHPLGKGNIEGGIKGSYIQSDNTIDYLNANNQSPPFDIAVTDEFSYKEQVYAGYLSVDQDWEHWFLKAGLRVEQTEIEAYSITLQDISKQNYFKFFPSFYLKRNLGKVGSMALDYSRRINRPKYADLNPFRFFLNENDYYEGNPNLIPNFIHSFNLNFSFSDTYFIDFYYRDNGNYISNLSLQDNQNQTLRQIYQNAQSSVSYGVDFTVSANLTNFWYLYLYQSLFYEDEVFEATESDIEFYKNEITGYYASMNNAFTLTEDGSFQGEFSVTYYTGFIYGSYKLEESLLFNAGLRKSFDKNRLIISLRGEDILGKFNPWYRSYYANQDNGYISFPETQFVQLGLTYNFGNYRLKNQTRDLGKTELDRLQQD